MHIPTVSRVDATAQADCSTARLHLAGFLIGGEHEQSFQLAVGDYGGAIGSGIAGSAAGGEGAAVSDIDPIKWLDDLWVSIRYGRGVLLEWPVSAATGGQVEMMLRKYGIRVFHRQYTNGQGRPYGASVKPQQAKWARYLLDTYLAGGKMPTAWGVHARPTGFLGWVADWMWGGIE